MGSGYFMRGCSRLVVRCGCTQNRECPEVSSSMEARGFVKEDGESSELVVVVGEVGAE
jgi:hypothetical protein